MLKTIDTHAAARLLDSDAADLVDVREADEFARSRIPGARNLPLSRLSGTISDPPPGRMIVFLCLSGARTASQAGRLAEFAGGHDAAILEGGMRAWQAAGLAVEQDRRQPIPLMRQVQIAAGGLALGGAVLGFAVAPGFHAIPALVGAGLVFAGITGTCGMARLLMHMPWNRAAA